MSLAHVFIIECHLYHAGCLHSGKGSFGNEMNKAMQIAQSLLPHLHYLLVSFFSSSKLPFNKINRYVLNIWIKILHIIIRKPKTQNQMVHVSSQKCSLIPSPDIPFLHLGLISTCFNCFTALWISSQNNVLRERENRGQEKLQGRDGKWKRVGILTCGKVVGALRRSFFFQAAGQQHYQRIYI